ncbi:MAG: urease accessory protein UreD [Acidimicrobiia bacterium]
MIGTAAGPVGGDHLTLDVQVRAQSQLTVRSVAASMVFPGPSKLPSRTEVNIDVGPGATLTWQPEATVLVRGCDHIADTTITLASTASLVWREELILGRWGETSGSVQQKLRVTRGGQVLIHLGMRLGPRWPESFGPAGVADALVVASMVIAGPSALDALAAAHRDDDSMHHDDVAWHSFPVADDAVVMQVLGPSLERVRRALDGVTARVRTEG